MQRIGVGAGVKIMAKQKTTDQPKKRKRLNGRSCRTKGHSFERWVASEMRKIFPGAKRHLEYQTDEAAKGIDLDGCGDYKIQCKRGRKYSSLSAIEQVKLDPIESGVKVLVTKGDHKEPLACIPFSHFIKLIKNEKQLRKILEW